MKYKALKTKAAAKGFLICLSFLISSYFIIVNLPVIKINTNIQKSAVSDVIVNTKFINNKVSSVKIFKDICVYILNKYFSPKSFLTDTFPALSQQSAIPKVEILDNPKQNIPQKPANSNVVEMQKASKNLEIKNETGYKVDVQSVLSEKPSFQKTAGKPLVLIVHTHSSEAYESNGEYELSDTDRTQDSNYNVIRVGNELAKILENKGIGVVHDETVHDYPSYTNSYINTLKTIEKNLKAYPSIQIVFDIHRDALSDGEKKIKLTTTINGETAAQAMLVCGTNSMGLEFDDWEDNLRFAMQIQDRLERCYPGLARPINLRKERFNLHATKGSILVEIGTNGNTLSEALTCIKYLGDTIGDVINDLCV